MISVINLQKSFEGKSVLSCDRKDFNEGQIHGIVGLNGAGKTTFFNILAKFQKPDSGHIIFNERKITREDITYLETNNFFYSRITGREYLDLFAGTNTQFDLDKINTLLKLPLNEIVETYSTGMKKKLAILSVIKQDKPIYIMDEPSNGLDIETNMALEIIIRNLKNRNKTIFVSSHILSPLSDICDEIHLLQSGRFTHDYQKENFNKIENDLLKDFITNANELIKEAV